MLIGAVINTIIIIITEEKGAGYSSKSSAIVMLAMTTMVPQFALSRTENFSPTVMF